VADAQILPHANQIYQLILAYVQSKVNMQAFKLLAALVFTLIVNFMLDGTAEFASMPDLESVVSSPSSTMSWIMA